MGELKSCPFCGEARVSDPNGAFGLTLLMTDVWWVACQTCGCQSQARKTIKQARAAWNRRALTPAQHAAEEMVEALRGIIAALELGGYMKRGEFYYYGVHDPAMTAPLAAARAALAKAGKP